MITAALFGTFAGAQQIGCLATTGSVVGSYTYMATEMPLGEMAISPPHDNKPVTFDGNGNVIPQTVRSTSPLGSFQYAGKYTVNLNYTATLTLAAPPRHRRLEPRRRP